MQTLKKKQRTKPKENSKSESEEIHGAIDITALMKKIDEVQSDVTVIKKKVEPQRRYCGC